MPNKHKKLEAYKHRLRREYRISLEELHEIYEDQFGRCAICERLGRVNGIKEQTTRKLVVDHCHKTGKVRGLLCTKCNTSLASIENKRWLEKAKEYVANHSATSNMADHLA